MRHTELNKLNEIKILMKSGQITYEEARVEAGPILSKINQKGEKIAKKFGQKYNPISFTGFMR